MNDQILSTVPVPAVITPGDRFGMTLCLAIIFHAIIILGVTFKPEDRMPPRYDTMEITLVQQKQPEPVEDANLLAQADLEGGGDTPEDIVPSTPMQPPFPDQKPQITAAEPTTPRTETQIKPEKTDNIQQAENEVEQQIVARADNTEMAVPEPEKRKLEQKQITQPSAAELLRNSFNIAALSAQIKEKLEAKAHRPRRTFISASTKTYKYAAYMEAWRAKVERIGNINYPDEARKRKLSGSLILDVALNPDGTINDIVIRRSSGQKVLDDAAIRIVHLASPYAPFPDDIRKDTDILHITRTWQFLNNRGFR